MTPKRSFMSSMATGTTLKLAAIGVQSVDQRLSLKAHGNSDSRAIKNALKVASKFIELNFIEELRKTMEVE